MECPRKVQWQQALPYPTCLYIAYFLRIAKQRWLNQVFDQRRSEFTARKAVGSTHFKLRNFKLPKLRSVVCK